MFNDPELNVGDSKLNIKGGGYEINYIYGDPAMLVLPPEKNLEFPEPEITFNMSKDKFNTNMLNMVTKNIDTKINNSNQSFVIC